MSIPAPNIVYNRKKAAKISQKELGERGCIKGSGIFGKTKSLHKKRLREYCSAPSRYTATTSSGKGDIPTDILIKLSRFYKVSTDYILGLTDDPDQHKK